MAQKTDSLMEKQMKKKKAIRVTGIVFLVIFAAISVLSLIFYNEIDAFVAKFTPGEDTELNKLLSDLVMLIPRLIRSVQILFIVLLLLYLLGIIYASIFKGTPRRVTIGKLVSSITKGVLWIVGILFILAVWGMDVSALIASAGVLTLIIGLGMQSLIADVVAGVFLVCDGALQVGDVVVIDGWRGTVQEIGIRTTRLINYSGDIRVANNSTITTYINQSRVRSCPTVTISITYQEDVRRVEKLFEENAQKIREMLPLVTEGPYYWGVNALSSSSVDLLFAAYCKEDDFFQVQRDMNRALRIFFMEHNIDIPFPQVVVHEEAGKTE